MNIESDGIPGPIGSSTDALSVAPVLQLWAARLVVPVAAAAVLSAVVWAHSPNEGGKFLGGLNWGDKVFNWHVVCMVIFFGSVAVALVQHRLSASNRVAAKHVHIALHTVAALSLVVGLCAGK